MVKKLVSVALCLSIILGISQNALATVKKEEPQDNIVYRNDTVVTLATPEQVSEHKKYDLYHTEGKFVQTVCPTNSIKDAILARCTEIKNEKIGELVARTYSSLDLEEFLFNCLEVTSVSAIEEMLYICYRTTENQSVTLSYNSQGLFDKVVYYEVSDTVYYEKDGVGTIYENFRTGTGYTVVEPDDTQSQIPRAEEFGLNLEGVTTKAIAQPASSSGPVGFQTEAELQAHLESRFVPYTNRTAYATMMYSNWLGEWIPIIVRDSRYLYQKKSADFRSFLAETAITLVATFLGGPPTVAVAILTGMGIALSGIDYIAEAVTLYRSAVYTYYERRIGCAYDDTLYDDYVNVSGYMVRGEFTGGYNADGIFDWVISKPTTVFNNDCEEIADQTLYNYENDVYMNGFCSMYFPD